MKQISQARTDTREFFRTKASPPDYPTDYPASRSLAAGISLSFKYYKTIGSYRQWNALSNKEFIANGISVETRIALFDEEHLVDKTANKIFLGTFLECGIGFL